MDTVIDDIITDILYNNISLIGFMLKCEASEITYGNQRISAISYRGNELSTSIGILGTFNSDSEYMEFHMSYIYNCKDIADLVVVSSRHDKLNIKDYISNLMVIGYNKGLRNKVCYRNGHLTININSIEQRNKCICLS